VRFQPGARLLAEGGYVISRHDGHTHLSYALDPSTRFTPLHSALRIEPRGSEIIAVLNPHRRRLRGAPFGKGAEPRGGEVAASRAERSPAEARSGAAGDRGGKGEEEVFPSDLQALFRQRRFAPLDPPGFLD